jgi:hypothetical protein
MLCLCRTQVSASHPLSPLTGWCARGGGAQQKGKGKATGGGSGAGAGPSNKAAAAGSSSGEASTSRGEGSRPSTLPSEAAAPHSTVEDAVLPSAEATSDTQKPAGGGKKEKERQRKERQRQRRMDEAGEALQLAIEAMLAGARCVIPLWLMCIGRYPPFHGKVVSMGGWKGALTCGGVWLQRGELIVGRGGGGDGGGGEARGPQ